MAIINYHTGMRDEFLESGDVPGAVFEKTDELFYTAVLLAVGPDDYSVEWMRKLFEMLARGHIITGPKLFSYKVWLARKTRELEQCTS